MITTTTATCISVIHDICSCKSHKYITEIQGAVVFVNIRWCDLLLHMSCITEIEGAVVVYYRCSCKSHHHMITITTASCISVIHDICSCKSHIWWCDLQLHMSCITEIQGAVVFVIICWCDLQLHMSYIFQ
jgi:hypothetical protein